MSEVKGLKLKVNFATGVRAGGLNPREPAYYCDASWQNLETGYEVRVMRRAELAEKFTGKPEVTILNGWDEIRAAIAEICPDREMYVVTNESIMNRHMQTAEIDWEQLDQQADKDEELKFLYDNGIRGISKVINSPRDPEEVMEEWL